jgi:hypothetical protein
MPSFARLLLVAALLFTACLRRPVAREEPTTKISFETALQQPAVDKIDVLVMIDDSPSMADKQKILASAVPDLLEPLVRPMCVDRTTRSPRGVRADVNRPEAEMCPQGSEPAFPPITDMHIGVLSSSLGGLGATPCTGIEGGHLIGPNGFLAWYPDVERNRDKARHPEPPVPKVTTFGDLTTGFRERIVAVGQSGCGLEAQLESVYRFLVQPDPWVRIVREGGVATYGPPEAIDREILRQRAAFLRPDSLVAILLLTDEDDSIADPLAFRGSGWAFMERPPMPRATAACAGDPTSPACDSCALVPPDTAGCDPRTYAPAEDPVDVRFHHMKARFGVDPQFPIHRYADALTNARVPARGMEHDAQGRYAPTPGCTNPLFAAKLPTTADDELCKLPRGPRSPQLVYFAIIGGVPNALLPKGPDDPIDWTPIVGRDPDRLDESGIDLHMIASTTPRAGLAPPTAPADADPIHGREWSTRGVDLQYACTFPLFEQDASGAAIPIRRVCEDPRALCDCDGWSDSPLCASDDRSIQTHGKAYPTRRPLLVARALGERGIAASLCPAQLREPSADDYGYRPAVRAITSRLERSLVASCLPRALARDDDGEVPCLVLAVLPEGVSCDRFALAPPPQAIVRQTLTQLEEEGQTSAVDVCELPQLVVAPGEVCRYASDAIAFCYTEAPAVTRCAHALTFTKKSEQLEGARFLLQCIHQSQ